MKHVRAIVILICILLIYLGGFYVFSKWIEWNFLFVYKNKLIKYGLIFLVFLICFSFVYRLKFKDEEKHNSIKKFFMKLGISIVLSAILYSFFLSLMTKVLYNIAKVKYFSEAQVVRVSGYSKSETIEMVSATTEYINIEWNPMAVRFKLEDEKYEISDIRNLQENDRVKIYGRKNFAGLAIDSIYKRKY